MKRIEVLLLKPFSVRKAATAINISWIHPQFLWIGSAPEQLTEDEALNFGRKTNDDNFAKDRLIMNRRFLLLLLKVSL